MRYPVLVASLAWLTASTAAPAAFYFRPPDLAPGPVDGTEFGIITGPLTGATPTELRAALTWNLRAGLNVAALQCQFEETLLTRNQYNTLLDNHRDELAAAYQTLSNYFKRTQPKTAVAGFDAYGNRLYSGFSTVLAQYSFCYSAGQIGRQAVFAPKGQLYRVAEARLREFRNSLRPGLYERQFVFWPPMVRDATPSLENRCWKRDRLRDECRVI